MTPFDILEFINSGHILTIAIFLLAHLLKRAGHPIWRKAMVFSSYIFATIGTLCVLLIFFLHVVRSRTDIFMTIVIILPYLLGQFIWLKRFRENKLLLTIIMFLLVLYSFTLHSVTFTDLPYPGQDAVFMSIFFFRTSIFYALIYTALALAFALSFLKWPVRNIKI